MTFNNELEISADDPRLTAYAFGELDGADRASVEAAVERDPQLRAVVEELRALGGDLGAALAGELLVLPEVVVPAAATAATTATAAAAAGGAGGIAGLLLKFPGWGYLAGGLAAAGVALVVVVNTYQPPGPVAAAAKPETRHAVMQVVDGAHEMTALQKVEHQAQVARRDAAAPAAPAMAKLSEKLVQSALIDADRFAVSVPTMEPALVPLGGMGAGLGYANSQAGAAVRLAAPAFLGAAGSAGQGFNTGLGMGAASYGEKSGLESYTKPADNAWKRAEAEPLSTFSIDVDTAGYSNVRRFLTMGKRPPVQAVRVEELVNYFPYDYAPPAASWGEGAAPFAAHLEAGEAPWAKGHRLVKIGIKGREFAPKERPRANLVFLLDVSGSMSAQNKLPLVKESLRMLVGRLQPDDRVAIVTYAGAAGLALPSTRAERADAIVGALDNLESGGSTNGGMGIHLAYDIAKANFVTGGVNRVILCTDGDFNVGESNPARLVQLIEEKAKSRVFLSVLGFGMGNLKDSTLESLANKGNGSYGYIDTVAEARKVFVEQVDGTLATIAKDVKIQVEFNPERVASYRLIGYENRMLKKEDFNNDTIDAGEIGAGHTVTALYEIVTVDAETQAAAAGAGGGEVRPLVDPLKYGKGPKAEGVKPKPVKRTGAAGAGELLTVKIRYKAPEGDVSRKLEFPLRDAGPVAFAKGSTDFRFAAAVAAWGMILGDSPERGTATFTDVLGWAEGALGEDAGGYRGEFLGLVRRSADVR